ncbi:AMP-binding protein [Calidifontibacter indicus]|uniref:AMP-binding protein n=1 Tax=Calidifontibacter indicus TaxID=419650 RepID=UPI003D742757
MSAPAWTFRNTWMTHTATHAQMQPDNPAMRFRGETTTWAQLSQRSLQGTGGIAERGVTKGDRVAMLALNHPSFVEALLAINSAGTIAVPINFRLSPPEVDYILRDSTPSAIFVDAMLLPLLRAVPALADVATVIVFGAAPEGAGQESDLDYAQFVAAHEPLMNDVAQGEVGEIVYRGPTITKGYWNRPAETEDAFAGGWFHSGDLVRQDEEGFVWVVDRKKDMIISGGENIYCAEVENVISEIPSVLEVAVIGRPDDKWGQVPVAYVTVHPGDELTIDQLRSHLDGKLATYKMPKDLVTTDALPRNAGGKIVKSTLRTQDADTAS